MPSPSNVCPRCNGKGTLDFYQLSDYFDCPDCGGTGVRQGFHLNTELVDWWPLPQVWRFVKRAFWVVLAMAFVLALIFGPAIKAYPFRQACTALGGHYVAQVFTTDECWSADGSHRLFPEPAPL